MGTFGRTTPNPNSGFTSSNQMTGSLFLCSESGVVTQISGWIYSWNDPKLGAFAIYDSAGNLLGVSNTVSAPVGPVVAFTDGAMPTQPAVVAGNSYYLMYLGQNAALGGQWVGATANMVGAPATYPTFPTTFVPTVQVANSEAAIYATVAPSGGGWSLAISAGVGGTVSVSSLSGPIGGSTGAITAFPDTNYVFSNWLYDGARFTGDTSATIDLTINDALTHTLEAVFTYVPPITQYTLTVNSDPSGIEFTIT